MNSPVEQFTIKTLYELNFMGIDVSFTNASLFMMLSILGSVCFLYFGSRKQALIPGRFQSLVEMSYEFVANMVKENAGKGSQAYFPFIFTLFMFILFACSKSTETSLLMPFCSIVTPKSLFILAIVNLWCVTTKK